VSSFRAVSVYDAVPVIHGRVRRATVCQRTDAVLCSCLSHARGDVTERDEKSTGVSSLHAVLILHDAIAIKEYDDDDDDDDELIMMIATVGKYRRTKCRKFAIVAVNTLSLLLILE